MHLQQLILASNFIQNLLTSLFDGLHFLVHVDLSYNRLSVININIFDKLKSLKSINMIQDQRMVVLFNSFQSGSLKLLLTTDFRTCCIAHFSWANIICTANKQWPHTCGNLIMNRGLKISVWILSFLIL